MIRILFFGMLALHGLIHVLGFAKGMGLADLPQLTKPVSRFMGYVWLLAGLLCLLAAGAGWAWPRGWWMIGIVALVLSQSAILASWADAKFGTLANLLLLAGVIHALVA